MLIQSTYYDLCTLLEIYFGGGKYRNFDSFGHFAPKIISAEIYL